MAAAGTADVDMAFGREAEVAYPCVGELGSGTVAGFITLLVVVVDACLAAPSGSMLVSEMPLGTTVVSVLFFLLRLFRE